MSLHRCYDGKHCQRGAVMPDTASPDDGLVFPISIDRPVGAAAGCDNLDRDVRIIQKALNRVPPAMGGPSPKLKIDGIVGKFTTGGIEKFQRRQLGFVDFKVEPQRKTIAKLNELEATVWTEVKPRTIEKVYKDILPQVHRCVVAADAALLSARSTLLGPSSGGLRSGEASAALVNRYFFLNKNPNAERDFEMIRRIIRNMIALVNRNQHGAEQTFVAVPGRYSATRMITSGVLAEAMANGVALTGTLKAKAQDGADFELPLDKILIMVPFAFTTLDGQIMTLIHEMAHFLGGADGGPQSIDDPPSRSSAQSEIDKLPLTRRPFLAENYALFAFDACFRRPPFRLTV